MTQDEALALLCVLIARDCPDYTLSPEEISDITGISRRAIFNAQHRALTKMRKRLGGNTKLSRELKTVLRQLNSRDR